MRTTDAGSEIGFEVEDDGTGIAPEDLPHVFDRFAQGGDHAARQGGSGLGLAIVREAARLHGGDAEVRSAPGGGTCFTLRIPRVLVDAEARSPRAGTVAETAFGARSEAPMGDLVIPPDADASPGWEGPQDAPLVLVVEDNPDLRSFISHVLAARYLVRSAEDGAEGLLLARTLRPEVVVSDVAMPKMSGLDLCRALRLEDATAATPVILVTAYGAPEKVLEGFEAGADDYIAKPFHPRELLARVGVHVRVRRMVQQMAHQERLASLGLLAASVAHQARNALTALVGGLPAMKRRLDGHMDAPTREMMDVMIGCTERLERMTQDLLDLSRVDRSLVGRFRPGVGLSAALRLVSVQVASTVEVDSDVDEHTEVTGRAGDMNQVFLNLIDNAARAVDERGRIRIIGRAEGEGYLVRVEDSGSGVDPKLSDHVFDPFVTTRGAGEGTGLGLAIARQVVEQHGGTITVGRSDLGGASFTVWLPEGTMGEAVVA